MEAALLDGSSTIELRQELVDLMVEEPDRRVAGRGGVTPEGGLVLDPFAGTGTTNLVAFQLGRRSVGLDISDEYLRTAEERCRLLL